MSEKVEQLTAILDLRGKDCVELRLELRKKIAEIEKDTILKIITDNPKSIKTIPSWCETNEQELFLSDEREEALIFFIRKTD